MKEKGQEAAESTRYGIHFPPMHAAMQRLAAPLQSYFCSHQHY
jgi:hypothetical protein